mmetsp:Transcript_123494/g.335358  ORF Transcript_123494/g.335358 Transcript_123494/m.335358 type:complete len:254 (-) Transcript_123494:1909-2670(-)
MQRQAGPSFESVPLDSSESSSSSELSLSSVSLAASLEPPESSDLPSPSSSSSSPAPSDWLADGLLVHCPHVRGHWRWTASFMSSLWHHPYFWYRAQVKLEKMSAQTLGTPPSAHILQLLLQALANSASSQKPSPSSSHLTHLPSTAQASTHGSSLHTSSSAAAAYFCLCVAFVTEDGATAMSAVMLGWHCPQVRGHSSFMKDILQYLVWSTHCSHRPEIAMNVSMQEESAHVSLLTLHSSHVFRHLTLAAPLL